MPRINLTTFERDLLARAAEYVLADAWPWDSDNDNPEVDAAVLQSARAVRRRLRGRRCGRDRAARQGVAVEPASQKNPRRSMIMTTNFQPTKIVHLIVGTQLLHGVDNPLFACGSARSGSQGVEDLDAMTSGRNGRAACTGCIRALFGEKFGSDGLNGFARGLFATTIAARVAQDVEVVSARRDLCDRLAEARGLFTRAAEELAKAEAEVDRVLSGTSFREVTDLAAEPSQQVGYAASNLRTDLLVKAAAKLTCATKRVERQAFAEHGVDTERYYRDLNAARSGEKEA